jgi:hypothetical protein
MCCAVGGREMAKPNAKLCKTWSKHSKAEEKLDQYPNWQCFHKPSIMPEQIAKI